MSFSGECFICINYGGDNICRAYPNGIPIQILSGEQSHEINRPGDNGIKFESKYRLKVKNELKG